MNLKRLEELDKLINTEIECNRLKDVSIQIEHEGKVCFSHFYGNAKQDSIYKIYSMSKPITSTAIMMLFENGKFDLDEPISKYLPFFANMKVVVPEKFDTSKATGLCLTKLGNLVMDCKTPITIRHILNMTSGMVYPGDTTVAEREVSYAQNEIHTRLANGEHYSNLDVCKRIAECPLEFEPGSSWKYGFGADVAGCLVEVLSGIRFGDFLKQNIFEPLGMKDTWFSVPEKNLSRIIKPYSRKQDGHLEPVDEGQLIWLGQDHPEKEVVFQSGGGYLYSTLEDYSKFTRVLLNGGSVNGKHYLGRKTVDFMHTGQLTDFQKPVFWLHNEGYDYANFMRTLVYPEKTGCGSVGEFGWDGLPGTYFLVDQHEKLQYVYLQEICEGADYNLRRKIRNIIYSALE